MKLDWKNLLAVFGVVAAYSGRAYWLNKRM